MAIHYIEDDPYIKEIEPEIECDEARCVCHVVSSTLKNGAKVCAHVRRLIHRKSQLHRFLQQAMGTFAGRHHAHDTLVCKMESIIVRTGKHPRHWTSLSGLYKDEKVFVITLTLEINGESHYDRKTHGHDMHKWFTHYEQWIATVQADGEIASVVQVDDTTRDHEFSHGF
jgi:hypothetical protein